MTQILKIIKTVKLRYADCLIQETSKTNYTVPVLNVNVEWPPEDCTSINYGKFSK